MGWVDKLLGGSIAQPIEAVGKIVDNVYTSKDEKLTHAEVMERIKQTPQLAQVDVNKIEAAHRTLFVAGWRPAVGWVCALALFNFFLINPWLQWYTGKAGPTIDIIPMIGLVTSMLGVAMLRTAEKKAGVTK